MGMKHPRNHRPDLLWREVHTSGRTGSRPTYVCLASDGYYHLLDWGLMWQLVGPIVVHIAQEDVITEHYYDPLEALAQIP